MTIRVSFEGKQPLQVVTAGNFGLWHYQVELDPSVTTGEIGLGFSSRVDIQDPAGYLGVSEVQPTRLSRGLGPVQFVAVDIAHAVGGKLDIYVIAPPTSDAFTGVTLVNFAPVTGLAKSLEFATASGTTSNDSQILEGPAATKSSATTAPGAAPPRLLPYASEPFGVYQPLIGWRSGLHRERIADAIGQRFMRAATLVGEDAMLSVERPIVPVETAVATDRTGTLIGRQLAVDLAVHGAGGLGGGAWHALLASTPDSPLASATRAVVTALHGQDVQPAVAIRGLTHDDLSRTGASPGTADAQISREATTATLLHYLGQNSPAVVSEMFQPSMAPWQRAVAAAQWFAEDHTARGAFLSPIGLLHLFREYFFELGTFLGVPVGHVWLSPGGTVELIEVNTRRTLVERTVEQSTETVQKTELSQTDQDELSDSVKVENANDTKLGVTASASGGVAGIFQASGSASFNLDSSRKQAQEQTHKRMREQSSKLSSEVRQNFKTTFRTVTETTDTSSRRYLLQNTTDQLVSYELSRKMRKVAVQVQDLGQQLCWQLYIDKPGDTLGIGEFVHATAKALDPGVKQPDQKPYPGNIEKPYPLSIPFKLYQGADHDAGDTYQTDPDRSDHGKFKPDAGSADIIQFSFDFTCPAAPPGFVMSGVSHIDFHGADVTFVVENVNPATDSFTVRLTYANFGGSHTLPFDAVIAYVPTAAAKTAIDTANNAATAAYNDEVAHKKEELFYDTLRTRLKLVGKVVPRPQDDLREEERDVVYRAIIARLYGSEMGWTNDDYHVASELIRYLFDIDAMLYFVAPDWWRPRSQPLVPINQQGELQPTIVADPAVSDQVIDLGLISVTIPGHRPYYPITEETVPAPMGASLGWLVQLDGDVHRNAFLNSPWVKAVLPIRPGRERDAIAWLGRPEVAGTDGLSEPYPYDAAADPPEYQGKTIEEVLLLIADKIAKEYSDSLVPVAVDPAAVKPQLALPAETVFTHGFDPLEGGIKFSTDPFKVFSQWIEILPTDQVVATEYNVNNLG